MKRILFPVLSVVLMVFYASPVFLAQADTTSSPPAGTALPSVSVAPTTADDLLYLHITAYSSTVDQTDSTPFITANGTYVHDGIVATNLLPFGTRVEIPALFGDKVFTVEDRMNARMVGRMDIWMSSRDKAIVFGSQYADVVVLGQATSSEVVADAANL